MAKIDAVERTTEAARVALGCAPDLLESARADRLAGKPLIEIAQDLANNGAALRVAAAQAYRDYEHAVYELRAAVVRALVEEEGLTLSQLAQAMGLTRQTVTRLYQAGCGRRE